MDGFVIIFSIFMAVIGLLMKYEPRLISPYGNMPEEKLENVDLKAISRLFSKGFLLIGTLMIALYALFKWLLDMPAVAQGVWVAPIFIITPILLAMAQKYDKNPRGRFKKYWPAWLIGAMIVGVSAIIVWGVQPSQAIVENDVVRFTGQYGVTVPLDDIARCELLEEIPAIVARVHGMSIGDIRKGQFRLAGEGKCRLLIKRGNTPYLYIETKTGEKTIFNSPDPTLTEGLFEVIQP